MPACLLPVKPSVTLWLVGAFFLSSTAYGQQPTLQCLIHGESACKYNTAAAGSTPCCRAPGHAPPATAARHKYSALDCNCCSASQQACKASRCMLSHKAPCSSIQDKPHQQAANLHCRRSVDKPHTAISMPTKACKPFILLKQAEAARSASRHW